MIEKPAWKPAARRMPPQQAVSDGVKSAAPERGDIVREQSRHALEHLARGLVREGQQQDVRRRDAVFDQIRHAVSERARLAAPRPRDHQRRPRRRLHRRALLLIQLRGEIDPGSRGGGAMQDVLAGHGWTKTNRDGTRASQRALLFPWTFACHAPQLGSPMKPLLLALFAALPLASLAQQPTPAPPKPPFTGFGNTALDQRPSKLKPGLSLVTPAASPVPVNTPGSAGIVLARNWDGKIGEGAGGQTMKRDDLRALLTDYGKPEADLAAHPEVTIYEGPRLDGSLEPCRLPWLTPLAKAEALLLGRHGLSTTTPAVAPGFPAGLTLHTYDIHSLIYNRACLVTDGAHPQPQVVAVLLKGEGVNWYPSSPPWVKIPREWHTFDYVNAQNRAQPIQAIDTRIQDRRPEDHFIVVNTTGGIASTEIAEPGIVIRPAQASPKETTTWYLPEPLIRLILFTLGRQTPG